MFKIEKVSGVCNQVFYLRMDIEGKLIIRLSELSEKLMEYKTILLELEKNRELYQQRREILRLVWLIYYYVLYTVGVLIFVFCLSHPDLLNYILYNPIPSYPFISYILSSFPTLYHSYISSFLPIFIKISHNQVTLRYL